MYVAIVDTEETAFIAYGESKAVAVSNLYLEHGTDLPKEYEIHIFMEVEAIGVAEED